MDAKPMTDFIRPSMEHLGLKEIPATSSNAGIPHKLRIKAEDIVPVLYGNYALEAFKMVTQIEDNERLLNQCTRIAKWMSMTECKNSIVLQGDIGVGKTTMLKAMHKVYRLMGARSLIIEADRMAAIYRDYSETYAMMKSPSTEYLLIDDVGAENTEFKDYGMPVAPFVEVINTRYAENLPVIITTNLKFSADCNQFAEKYGDRVADRMRQMMNSYTIAGQSHRK